MDLAGRLNQILQVGASEEVAEVDEFGVVFIFDVDHSPAVLAATNLLPIDDNILLAPDNREWNDILGFVSGDAQRAGYRG